MRTEKKSARRNSNVVERDYQFVPRRSSKLNPSSSSSAKRNIAAYLIMAPGLVLLSVFVIIPIFSGFWTSLHAFDGLNPMEWVGVRNYKAILGDPHFLKSVSNTILFAVVVVTGKNALGFLIAFLINRTFIGVKIVRTLLFLPVTLNILVIGSFWTFFLALDNGLLNSIFRAVGLDFLAQGWLSNSAFALFSVAFVEIWRWLPLHVLIYLAGLQELPADVDEAARLDGASSGRKIWQITIPMMKPIIFVNVIISLTGAFVRSFEMVWVLTKGTAGTNIVLTNMYTEAFQAGRFGSAAAMGVFLFVITAVISFAYVKLSKGGQHE